MRHRARHGRGHRGGWLGETTFGVIEAAPERLKEASDIGPTQAARIVFGRAELKAVREVMIFLYAHGIGTARAVRIFKTYGRESIVVITKVPYCLARDIRVIGFRKTDDSAIGLGLRKIYRSSIRSAASLPKRTKRDANRMPVNAAWLSVGRRPSPPDERRVERSNCIPKFIG